MQPPDAWSLRYEGKGGHVPETIDDAVHDAPFDESDIAMDPVSHGFSLVFRAEDTELATSERKWHIFDRYTIPVYEHVLAITGAGTVEFQDDAGTYDHRLDRIIHDTAADLWTIEATPPFTIVIHNISDATIQLERAPYPSSENIKLIPRFRWRDDNKRTW
jgi:hypothetical protein